tara:strand:+ start:36 stop:1169 length:1134 start_codon:yes stop_codon:yes gene_type:complete
MIKINSIKNQFNLIHVTSTHRRDDPRIFRRMIVSSLEKGFIVNFVLADGLGDLNESKENLNFIDVGKPKNKLFRVVITPLLLLFKIIKLDKKNIVQLHDPELLLIGFILKILNRKVIFDMHEDFPIQILAINWIKSTKIKFLISNLFKFSQSKIIRRFDGLLVVNTIMLNKYSYLNKNTNLIANYSVPKKNFKVKSINNRINIIYSGSITIARGFENMLNLMRFLPDNYHLNIAGKADNTIYKLLNKKDNNKITFHGYLNEKELNLLYKKSHIGLILFNNIAQYYMSYSLKLFEYMDNGLMILMPDFGQWNEFNATYDVGKNVNPKDSKKIASIIKNLDTNILMKYGEKNYSILCQHFNWKTESEKLIRIYKSLMLD